MTIAVTPLTQRHELGHVRPSLRGHGRGQLVFGGHKVVERQSLDEDALATRFEVVLEQLVVAMR